MLAATVALGGFLAGRRGYETVVAMLDGHGVGVGTAGVIAGLLYVVFVAGLTVASLRIVPIPDRLADHLPAAGALIQLSLGFGLGAAFVATTLAIELSTGLASLDGTALGQRLAGSLSAGFVDLAAIAAAEELVFRLAILQALARAMSWRTAVVLSSLAYAAVHIVGTPVWPVSLASLFCFGVVACELYAARRALWLPIGTHWAWDFISFAAFQVLPLRLSRVTWLAGLPYHLSAGLVMLLVLALTAAALAWRAPHRVSAEAAR